MNEDEIRLFGKLVSELRDLDQRRTEIFSEFLTEIGKPFMETPTKTEKPTELQFNGLKWVTKEGTRGVYEQIENDKSQAFKKLADYVKSKGGYCNIFGFKVFFHYNNESILDRKR